MLAHESVTINEAVHLTQIFLYLLANLNLWVCTTVWYLTCNCETLRAGLSRFYGPRCGGHGVEANCRGPSCRILCTAALCPLLGQRRGSSSSPSAASGCLLPPDGLVDAMSGSNGAPNNLSSIFAADMDLENQGEPRWPYPLSRSMGAARGPESSPITPPLRTLIWTGRARR